MRIQGRHLENIICQNTNRTGKRQNNTQDAKTGAAPKTKNAVTASAENKAKKMTQGCLYGSMSLLRVEEA